MNNFKLTEEQKTILSNVLNFMKVNQMFVIIFTIIVLWYDASTHEDTNENLKQCLANNAEISSYVNYYDSYTGVIKKVKQEKFDSASEDIKVARVLADLIQSGWQLSKDWKISKFENEMELFKSSNDFVEFYTNHIFIDVKDKNSTPYQIEMFSQITDHWDSIMTQYRLDFNANNLPHTIQIRRSLIQVKKWEPDEDRFKIKIVVPTFNTSRNNDNKVVAGKGKVEIDAEGYFDPLKETKDNDNGLKFTSLKMTYSKINSEHK